MGYLPNAALFATIGDILVSLKLYHLLKGAGKCYEKRNTKQVLLPLITSFIWGSSFVAQSLGAEKVGGFTFTAARSIPRRAGAGALVLILRRVRHEEKIHAAAEKRTC